MERPTDLFICRVLTICSLYLFCFLFVLCVVPLSFYIILYTTTLHYTTKDPSTTFVQLDASSSLPPPSYVHRSDVAELCVAACDLPLTTSYTMGIRAVGEAKGNKPQGAKDDGHATVKDCLAQIVAKLKKEPAQNVPKTKPYGLAVGLVVYSVMGVSLGVTGLIVSKALRVVLGRR
jgi:hypothetical protein